MYYLFGKKKMLAKFGSAYTEELLAIFTTFENAEAFTESCIDYSRKSYKQMSLLEGFDGFEIRKIDTDPSPFTLT